MDMPTGYGPDSEIDHEGMHPVWLQLAAILAARIESGRYAAGRPVPSLNQLRQEFGVARGTAVKATNHLADLGLVRAVHGKGVFVLPRTRG
ncbi:DNA-binding GntR family transcriptional regulator [Spinactinospora alkalitolerans]|uniref:DNA-binding GntR family transcriptional regulator n=1 Tax=Spinactinospora alkalitolerans TaxID=687207 RepID=A0A852TN40_9ACTN|nr:winged helix-turn-helix domain-containing protein [Spinactinospora alkalitolerans]NYE45005.1 DNA-binding GntR family transcriptional regulator [Spinactinospora alkalitolerans]